ncbi:MAG: hypothetical protein Nkreftii_004169 [Candidatus Nitrospira kreftii]|uniref:Uncharacterized protein n=1 Tax=Candidatus Nitrospira kreftii TaxID=2652173 RepID=A0A7S8FI72_9BACT|nr:MAG: hypothetical protein Nkreftii_004169 [Candidatus Nitrospira kreftii]
MITNVPLQTIILNLEEQITRASNQFSHWEDFREQAYEPSWVIEATFLQLLAALEYLGMPELRNAGYLEYKELATKKGFSQAKADQDGESYSVVLGRISCYLAALKGLLPGDKHTTVTKDLLDIIRNVIYVIANPDVFPEVPQNERDVHIRIESILKCVFPDLKHEPSLSKQIKNFEPDTGIPSLETLIEYKFLYRIEDVPTIADQLLADTRGYFSKDWVRFVYVIYETNRFRTENDWNQLMREAGVPINTTVVVLNGEPRLTARTSSRKKTQLKQESPTSL